MTATVPAETISDRTSSSESEWTTQEAQELDFPNWASTVPEGSHLELPEDSLSYQAGDSIPWLAIYSALSDGLTPSPAWAELFVNVTDRWTGFVTRLFDDHSFQVELQSADQDERDDTTLVEFTIDEVTEEDRALVREGAPVYVTSGRLHTRKRVRTVSSIRFRRLPNIAEEELQSARQRAGDRMEQLGMLVDDG